MDYALNDARAVDTCNCGQCIGSHKWKTYFTSNRRLLQSTEWVSKLVTHLISIQELIGSNICRVTNYCDKSFNVSPQSLHADFFVACSYILRESYLLFLAIYNHYGMSSDAGEALQISGRMPKELVNGHPYVRCYITNVIHVVT
jgi:hypothetical protein